MFGFVDNNLFLEGEMQKLLMALLKIYCGQIDRVKFDQPIPGLHSFSDLYSALLEQFEATSYGDKVFSQYVLLPMMQQQLVTYRKCVWTEHSLTQRSLFLSPAEVCLFGVI